MTKRFESNYRDRNNQFKELIKLSLNPFLHTTNIHFKSANFLEAYELAVEFRDLLVVTYGSTHVEVNHSPDSNILYYRFSIKLPGGRLNEIVFSSIPDDRNAIAFEPEHSSRPKWTGNDSDEDEISARISVIVADGVNFGRLSFDAIGRDGSIESVDAFCWNPFCSATLSSMNDKYSELDARLLFADTPTLKSITDGDKHDRIMKVAATKFHS